MTNFKLGTFDPTIPFDAAAHPLGGSGERALIALDIQTKYQFIDRTGAVRHEYGLPGSPEIQNCGGYFDKVVKYRDPALRQHLKSRGVSAESLGDPQFPILATRSPQLDLLIFLLVKKLREQDRCRRISIFDHGCSVAEHYDLLDTMLAADSGERARDVLDYCGLDMSALLLHTARMLHADVPLERFRLVHAEGSSLEFPDRSFDITLTVGVVNHVANPPRTLSRLLRCARHAAVMALWVTSEDKGFFAINHSGANAYFFSRSDLAQVQAENPDGKFLVANFIPETDSSQRRSYVGIDEKREESLGSYHLVFSRLPEAPFAFHALTF